jgi:hypothetical protein
MVTEPLITGSHRILKKKYWDPGEIKPLRGSGSQGKEYKV